MKKIITFNILITLSLFPYIMGRWVHWPFCEGIWTFEVFMVFGTLGVGVALSISNILLSFSMKWTRYKPLLLKSTMIFSSMLFPYPIYSGILLGLKGGAVIIDIAALILLYGNLWLSNKEYQKLINPSI
ncbi:hypothetical protein OAK19_00470 [Aureispira]|nr:hypothetical protein [Aureispira sp.]